MRTRVVNRRRGFQPVSIFFPSSSHPRSSAFICVHLRSSAVKIIPMSMPLINSQLIYSLTPPNPSRHIPTAFQRAPSLWELIGPSPRGRGTLDVQRSMFIRLSIHSSKPQTETIQQCSRLAFYILHSSFFIAFQSCPVVPDRAGGYPRSASCPPQPWRRRIRVHPLFLV